jgi:hypothetical protein
MRHLNLLLASLLACLPALSQSTDSNDAMSKTRGLYVAPLTRQLVSFDCLCNSIEEAFINTLEWFLLPLCQR